MAICSFDLRRAPGQLLVAGLLHFGPIFADAAFNLKVIIHDFELFEERDSVPEGFQREYWRGRSSWAAHRNLA